jgi:hypothetical protein
MAGFQTSTEEVFTMADLRVHDPDLGVHDRPILAFTVVRNAHLTAAAIGWESPAPASGSDRAQPEEGDPGSRAGGLALPGT